MKGSYRTAVAFVVFASLLLYFGLRLRNSIRSIDANGSCGDHKANSAQASSRTMDFSIRSSGIRANAPTMEDTIRLVTYPDSIWGQFRAENNDRFNEILHGFETKGALAPIDLFVCDENGDPIPGASVRLSWSTPDGLDHDKRVFGTTDSTGHFSAEERSIWAVGWRVEKDGYYTAYSNLELRAYASVQGWKERRWFRAPFPATAILRNKTPHEMLFRTVEERMPPAGVKMGFDLIDGKPTPPHGDGHVSDVVFFTKKSEARGENVLQKIDPLRFTWNCPETAMESQDSKWTSVRI